MLNGIGQQISKVVIFLVEDFTIESHPQQEEILRTLERLQTDHDKDVRYFANPIPENTSIGDYEDDAIEDIDVETVCSQFYGILS